MTDSNVLENQPIAWTPASDVVERAQLTKFMRQVGVSTWDELYQFSIRDVEKFTEEVLKFLDIRFDPPYDKLLDTSNGIEFPRWFQRSGDTPVPTDAAAASEPPSIAPSARGNERRFTASGDEDKSVLAPFAGLNITTMCLDRWQTDEKKDQPAVIWEGEDGTSFSWTYSELLKEVEHCAVGLRNCGIGKSDAVAIHLPMNGPIVTVLLAIGRIGAIAVPLFSGYGVEAIASRVNAVGAKALFTCDGFSRRGKWFNAFKIVSEAAARCPTIQKVVFGSLEGRFPEFPDERFEEWNEFLAFEWESGEIENLRSLRYAEPTSAEDPLIILYTSGTTGKPKGIVHTHASFPIKAAQDMAFGTDVGKGTRICWYTDLGWMMGPWLIYGALINGATICLYDGAPDYPTPDRMWQFCARHKVEVLGISPTLVRSLAAQEEQRSGDTLRSGDTQRSGDTPVPMSAEHEKPPRKGWTRHGNLPHFDGEVTQFITFRLADSLPQPVLERLRLETERDKLENDSEEFRQKVEEYLDQGSGECILRDPAVADILRSTLRQEDGKTCDLKAWVIMPNHAHLLLRMKPGHDLAGLMKRVKGVSARKINLQLGRSGSVWQHDYFDRYIRDGEHYSGVFHYIESNPVVAGLASNPEGWEFGSAERSGDTPVPTDAAAASDRASIAPSARDNERRFAASGDEDKSVLAPGDEDRSVLAPGDEDRSVLAPGDEDRSVLAPFERHDLSALRVFASTGEPWNPAPWWWLFERVGNSRLPIINYSGGTEISGGILMGNPLLPIKPCSFPAPCPGMDVDILNENGDPAGPNQVGELVIKQPWIGMARGFWHERERYLEAYWSRFKNIWVHGDWAMRDSDGHWFILGRSDDTLKVAGKRVGPAEVESLLVAHPLVTEAAVIGVPHEAKGTAMVAFCVLRSGDTPVPTDAAAASEPPSIAPSARDNERRFAASGDEDKSVLAPTGEDKSVLARLEAELKSLVARDMGKPLAPSKIHFVSALPKTRNAKVMRRVIRAAYLGEDPGDLSALEDPAAALEIRSANEPKHA